MNNPSNPILPHGSFLEPKTHGRARVKLAVFFVLTIHVVGLLALLAQGCRRQDVPPPVDEFTAETNAFPPFDVGASGIDTNMTATYSLPPVDTNPAGARLTTPALAPMEHTIASGETLSGSIAPRYGVTVQQILNANPGIDPNRLQVGQKLIIPAPSAPAGSTASTTTTVAPANGTQVYTVKSGDTLTAIANSFKTTVRAIRNANPQLTSDRIIVGQKLNIPAGNGQ